MPDRRPFQLLVKPVGADCNLRCDYCFYLRAGELYPRPGRHVMAEDVLETMIAGLMRLRFDQSVFAWQGGEPTLAGVDFFRKVVALEQKHGVSGQSVANSFQTNGILIDEEWCRLFRDYNFLIGLSIDGPKDVHDAVRHTVGGRGTWDRAMEAARLMDRFQVAYNILCVVHAGNVGLGADLMRWFIREGFPYLQFIPCLEPGLKHNVAPGAYGDFLCDVFDCWAGEGLGKVSVRDFDALVAAALSEPVQLCTYGKKCNNYIVVEHTGDVYPCDFFVYDEWKLGNVMDGPLDGFLECEKFKRFARRKYSVPACRGCPWRAMCHGGCQKDRRCAGSIERPTPFCAAYKRFFEHAMPRLKVLAKQVQRHRRRPGFAP
jgi:uncharacterized protein